MKKRLLLCLLAGAMALCAGCMKARSADEYGYGMTIGVDRGEKKTYRYSILLQMAGKSSEEAGSGELSVLSAEGDTLLEAMRSMESSLYYEIDLSRTELILIGYDLAKEQEALSQIFSQSLSGLKVRPSVMLMVALNGSKDFMDRLKENENVNLGRLQYSFAALAGSTGDLPVTTLAQYQEAVTAKRYDVVLPLCGPEENKKAETPQKDMVGCVNGHGEKLPGQTGQSGGIGVSAIGSAVFAGETVIGLLDGVHTEILLMAMGEYDTGTLTLPDFMGEPISVRLIPAGSPKVILSLTPEPTASLALSLNCTAESALPPGSEDALTQAAAQYLEAELQQIFLACRQAGADVFRFGREASKLFSSVREYEAFSWKDAYAKLTVAFQVNVTYQGDALARVEEG